MTIVSPIPQVSYHAVHRWLQRVLEVKPGENVRELPRGASSEQIALAWCADADLALECVRSAILTPIVCEGIALGAAQIRIGQHKLVVRGSVIVTVKPVQHMRSTIRSEREGRKLAQRAARRGKPGARGLRKREA